MLTERRQRLLQIIVDEYVTSAQPVGSSSLVEKHRLPYSSATVRSEMARLEEEGYITQPHTSAGRIPTDRAYRAYVDALVQIPALSGAETDRLAEEISAGGTAIEAILRRAAQSLGLLTQELGVALGPQMLDRTVLARIELVRLTSDRVLVVALSDRGQVTQKIVDAGELLTPEELRRAAEYVNREFVGLPIDQVQASIIARLQEVRGLYDRLMARAFELARRALEERTREHALFVEGTASLIGEASAQPELSLETLRTLVHMIEEKQRLVRLLEEYLHAPGLAVVIGAEHSLPDLKPFSLVAASYLDGQGGGSLGVIGPTRMRYSRAISMVESAARAVTAALDRN